VFLRLKLLWVILPPLTAIEALSEPKSM